MAVNRPLVVFAALCGALAVALGAFAAHGVGPHAKALLTTGSHYQIVHALLALVCAAWPGHGRRVITAGWLAAGGGLVFGLALTAVGLLRIPAFGAVAPIGGVLMIAGWLVLGFDVFRSHSVKA
jgi:uncharacterized membrane protein YgdD (TMEM256/DUF423 family)